MSDENEAGEAEPTMLDFTATMGESARSIVRAIVMRIHANEIRIRSQQLQIDTLRMLIEERKP